MIRVSRLLRAFSITSFPMTVCQRICGKYQHLSRDMRFPTMRYVRLARPQISLRICAVWSEPLLVAWIFFKCLATDWTSFGFFSKLKRRLHRLVWVYTCQMQHCWKSHVTTHFIFRLYSDYYHEYGRLRNTLEPGPKHFHQVVATGLQLYEECLQTRTLRSCVYDERIYDVVKVSSICMLHTCSTLARFHHIFFF